jgi:hypothetical protein
MESIFRLQEQVQKGNMVRGRRNAWALVDIVILFRFLKIGWNIL